MSGQVSKITKPNGEITKFEYDSDGNRTRLTYSGNPSGGTGDTFWVYDALGRPVSEKISDAQGLIPTVSVSNVAQAGSEDVGTLTFKINLSAPLITDVSVPFTLSGTATEGSDYTITPSPVVISAGDSWATITINVTDDSENEGDETVIVTLGSVSGVDLGTAAIQTATIIDDDDAASTPEVTVSSAAQSIAEDVGTATFDINLSSPASSAVTVPFTVTGSATGGGDYSITSGPVTIPAGETSATVTITVTDDTHDEPAETVVVTLGTPTGAGLGTITVHTATLTDNDDPKRTWTYLGDVTEYVDRNGVLHTTTVDRSLNTVNVEANNGALEYDRFTQYSSTGNVLYVSESLLESGSAVYDSYFQYDNDPSDLTIVNEFDLGFGSKSLNHENTYTLNQRGQVTSRVFTYDIHGTTPPSTPTDLWTDNYEYDWLGRLTETSRTINDLAGDVASIWHDAAEPDYKEVRYQYNADGSRTSVERYDSAAGVTPIATSQYEYTTGGRLKQLQHFNDTALTQIAEHNYGYDAAGRVVSQYDRYTNGAGSDYRVSNRMFEYDEAGQLERVNETIDAGTTVIHDYTDGQSSTSTDWLVGQDNRLFQDDRFDYVYDAEGRLISRTSRLTATAGDYDVFTWDPVGRLIRVVQHDASDNIQQTIEYGYDANGLMSGRRILDSSNAVTSETGYLHDGLQRIMELDLSGTEQAITKLYLHGTQPNEIVATDIYDGTDYDSVWAFTDILGSVTTVASEASGSWKIVHNASREYGSGREQFGDTTEAALTSTAVWAGHHLDEATGLLEAKARWYDPGSGRFIGQDPIGFKAGDANLYRYVGNGPGNGIDPDGMEIMAISGERIIDGASAGTYVHYFRGTPEQLNDILTNMNSGDTFGADPGNSLRYQRTNNPEIQLINAVCQGNAECEQWVVDRLRDPSLWDHSATGQYSKIVGIRTKPGESYHAQSHSVRNHAMGRSDASEMVRMLNVGDTMSGAPDHGNHIGFHVGTFSEFEKRIISTMQHAGYSSSATTAVLDSLPFEDYSSTSFKMKAFAIRAQVILAAEAPFSIGSLGAAGLRGLAARARGRGVSELYVHTWQGAWRGNTAGAGRGGRIWATPHSGSELANMSRPQRIWHIGRGKLPTDSVRVTGDALDEFVRIRGIGPFRLAWKRAGGQYFSKGPGSINLTTGVRTADLGSRLRYAAMSVGSYTMDGLLVGSISGSIYAYANGGWGSVFDTFFGSSERVGD